MTHYQFDTLVALLRGQQDTPANRAARAVLVDGHSQALAARVMGATRSTVADAVKRYSDAAEQVRTAFCLDMYASRSVQFNPSLTSGKQETQMKVKLKVCKHPSGRLTLTEQSETDHMAKDCTGVLFGSTDHLTFYKAVAKKIVQLNADGFCISYDDSQFAIRIQRHLTVKKEQNGSLSLWVKQDDMESHRCSGRLAENMDRASFYRLVAQTLSDYHAKGDEVIFTDVGC